MVEKDNYLIVVSVLEGHRFPKRPKHKLIVEAKFDGELLATDPVDHVESPDFTQELAWELDKKGLHQHRLQRASIKVQVYAQDTQSTMKEAIGYVILDLRSAQAVQTSKWWPLLHSKYSRSKPEIRLGIYLDDDKGSAGQAAAKAPQSKKGKGQQESSSSESSEWDPKNLKPVLNETEGYYQIGPEVTCGENFILSVTIAFATNLPHLIPTNIPLPSTGFFFYYSLLGNDVTNEPFHDLINPTFPAERASVRIRSSVEALRTFFSSQPGIQMHICCGDQSLGSCEIPLGSLLKKGSTEIFMKPVTLEGAFQLHPPNRLKQQLPVVGEDVRPTVGVSIALRKEDLAMSTPLTPTKEVESIPGGTTSPTADNKKPPPSPRSPPKEEKRGKAKEKKRDLSPPALRERRDRSASPPPTHDGSYTDTFEGGSKTDDNVSSLQDEVNKKQDAQPKKKKSPPQKPSNGLTSPDAMSPIAGPSGAASGSPSVPQEAGPSGAISRPPGPVMKLGTASDEGGSSSTTQAHLLVQAKAHHFCCSIDLRTFRLTDLSHPANVFLRYTYPFFGSAAPILTQPPVEIRKGAEVMLPQSFCAFNFATSPQQIHQTFNRVPLVVEVWDRDRTRSENTLLGAVELPLSAVLAMEKARAVHTSGASGWRQVWSDHVPVLLSNSAIPGSQKLGDLHVMISLEDWGLITHPPQDAPSESSQTESQSLGQKVVARAQSHQVAARAVEADPRETTEYKAAVELELWKEQQEVLFQSQLQEKEKAYMLALAEEWKRRDKEREVLVQKKLMEYTQLEEKLRKTIAELDKRDKQLAANEQEVMRLRSDLQREHERKMTEMREASRRMKEDCDHQVGLERTKIKELEEYVARLKQQLADEEVKVQSINKEFTSYKEQQGSKPEVRLQSEINLLTLEKVELERKLDMITKSKIHYKQQWGRALKELARLKQKEQNVARTELKRQQQELEHMRLRYLAAEEKEVVKSEKKQLEEIRQELQQLKDQETMKPQQTEDGTRMQALAPDLDLSGDEDHITRLIEERDSLLRTGVYTTDDKIISELDHQIREAIANRGR